MLVLAPPDAFSGPLGATGYHVTIVRFAGVDERVIGHGRAAVLRSRE